MLSVVISLAVSLVVSVALSLAVATFKKNAHCLLARAKEALTNFQGVPSDAQNYYVFVIEMYFGRTAPRRESFPGCPSHVPATRIAPRRGAVRGAAWGDITSAPHIASYDFEEDIDVGPLGHRFGAGGVAAVHFGPFRRPPTADRPPSESGHRVADARLDAAAEL